MTVKLASATVYGAYGSHEVTYAYEEISPGVLRPVLTDGTPWGIDGRPVPMDRVPVGWRAEVAYRLPDEEHGWTWEDER